MTSSESAAPFSRAEFCAQLADAYEHLYDLVYLRTHLLTGLLATTRDLSQKKLAWRLHDYLVDSIQELDPGPEAPPLSHERRRYRLMVLRYLDGLDPQSVADELIISRRHFYREREAAIEAIASVLWERRRDIVSPGERGASGTGSDSTLGLFREEASRAAEPDRHTRLGDVVAGTVPLLEEVLSQRRLVLCVEADEVPALPIDRGLFRQLLLGMLGYLIEWAENATLRLAVELRAAACHLSVWVEPPSSIRAPLPAQAQERIGGLEEMAALVGTELHLRRTGSTITGFDLEWSSRPWHTILVVDDNEEVLALFQRFLVPHHYHVITASTAQDALAQARHLQPDAITLDLMMPDQDGWDVLQTLLNQPRTQHIPILVCSVLKQKDLALSLGAAGFLEKPVTEEMLVSALKALRVC